MVETRPEAELKEYTGLAAKKPKVEVTDEDVESRSSDLQMRFASLEVAERPLQEGDFAQIDLTTTRHDETIDELTAKDLLIEVGAGDGRRPSSTPSCVGKRKGDILKINATLPEHFGERAGWQVGMTVLVKETKVRKLPALDDEFAKTVSEFDTLDELTRRHPHALTEMAGVAGRRNRLRESVLEAFARSAASRSTCPEGMVERRGRRSDHEPGAAARGPGHPARPLHGDRRTSTPTRSVRTVP